MTMPTAITATTTDRLAEMGDLFGGHDGWPAATSFPELDGLADLPPTRSWSDLADLLGADDPWCSGTSFPDLD